MAGDVGLVVHDLNGAIIRANPFAMMTIGIRRQGNMLLRDPRWQPIRPCGRVLEFEEAPAIRAAKRRISSNRISMGLMMPTFTTWIETYARPVDLDGQPCALTAFRIVGVDVSGRSGMDRTGVADVERRYLMTRLNEKPSPSAAEWVTRMSLLARDNREAYRAIRELMWAFVVENSGRSDFPSDMS